MISVILFTSGHYTQALIDVLKKAKNIELFNVYQKLPEKIEPANLFLVADFGQIIPKKMFTPTHDDKSGRRGPKYGCLCLHPSLLPKYRGPSPIQQAIIDGQKQTGLTVFLMDEKVDHGPIISQFKEKISNDDTAETLYERLFAAGAEVLVTILPAWTEGRIEPRKQNHAKATFTKKLTKEDGRINWRWPPEKIERFIRAMTPWPGAWTTAQTHPQGGVAPAAHPEGESVAKEKSTSEVKKRIKILKAHLEPSLPDRRHVTIPDRKFEKKRLVIDTVQLPGKNSISWQQFKAGHKDWELI